MHFGLVGASRDYFPEIALGSSRPISDIRVLEYDAEKRSMPGP
jgi:hypothetical protein